MMTVPEREKATVQCPTCKSTQGVPELGRFMAQMTRNS